MSVFILVAVITCSILIYGAEFYKIICIFQNTMDKFRCYYCVKASNDFAGIIDHSIIEHSEETLKLKIASQKGQHGKKQVFTKNFNIIPEEIKQDNKTIFPWFILGR